MKELVAHKVNFAKLSAEPIRLGWESEGEQQTLTVGDLLEGVQSGTIFVEVGGLFPEVTVDGVWRQCLDSSAAAMFALTILADDRRWSHGLELRPEEKQLRRETLLGDWAVFLLDASLTESIRVRVELFCLGYVDGRTVTSGLQFVHADLGAGLDAYMVAPEDTGVRVDPAAFAAYRTYFSTDQRGQYWSAKLALEHVGDHMASIPIWAVPSADALLVLAAGNENARKRDVQFRAAYELALEQTRLLRALNMKAMLLIGMTIGVLVLIWING